MEEEASLKTILVLSSILDDIARLSKILENKDYKVINLNLEQEIFELPKEALHSLILLDIIKTKENDFYLYKKLKKNPLTKNTPILFFGELNEKLNEISTFDLEEFNFIAKPFREAELLFRINMILANKNIKTNEGKDSEAIYLELNKYKAKEESILKLNRLYSILYQIDEAIVKIHDKKHLFNEICRIAFNEGKFFMSWIGIVTEENKVKVLASSGLTEDYLSKINIDLNDEMRSNGPTGRAIKSGQYAFSNDIKNDPTMKPWKKDALRIGYKSSACFPIKTSKKVIGVLTLYANEINFFTPEENKLLEKLASNISFDIEFIESEEKRKYTEKLLKESNEKFTKAFISTPDLITISNLNSQVLLSVNESFKKLLGYSENELLGKSTFDLNIWNDEINRNEFFAKLKREGLINNFETYFNTKNGDLLYVLISASIIEVSGEKCIFSIARDITELKKAEVTLLDKENHLKSISNNFMDGMIYQLIIKPDGTRNFTYLSESVKKLYGVSPEEAIKDSNLIYTRLYEEDIEVLKEAEATAIRELSKFSIEVRIKESSGELRWSSFVSKPTLMKDGSICFDGIEFVITERKLSENIIKAHFRINNFAIKNSLEALLQKILDEVCEITNSPIGFYHFVEADQETISLQAWSTSTMKHYCKAEGSGLHYNLSKAGVWADCIRERKAIIHNNYETLPNRKGLPEGHAALTRELVVPIIRDNLIVSILGVGNKAFDYNDKDLSLVYYFADVAWEIVQKKRAEEEIIKINNELEQRIIQRTEALENANKELESFSYSVSHDLRAPLRAIDGFSSLLLKNHSETLGTEGQRLLHRVCDNAKKMGNLIDDILAFSRMNRKELTKSAINMNNLVLSVYNDLTSDQEKEIFSFLVEDLPLAKGDEAMINQVWVNLISNAIKFTSKKEKPQIEIGFKKEKEQNLYFIKDNGVGFDMKYSDKLFSVFQRLHTEQEYKGTGVGLAIVKSIINKHGGKIWVESEVNIGTTFYFYI